MRERRWPPVRVTFVNYSAAKLHVASQFLHPQCWYFVGLVADVGRLISLLAWHVRFLGIQADGKRVRTPNASSLSLQSGCVSVFVESCKAVRQQE